MSSSTRYAMPVRPGFDYLTMIQDWRDHLWLDGWMEPHELMAGLIVEVSRRQATLFRMDTASMGLDWDDLAGEFAIKPEYVDPIEKGFIQSPTREMVDEAWLDAFETVEADLDVLVETLTQGGGLY